MYDKIKKEIQEIIQIVKECPENLQEKCFELLLNQLLSEQKTVVPVKKKEEEIKETDPDKKNNEGESTEQNNLNNGEEISLTQLHIKTRKLLEQGNISTKDINHIYYLDEGKIKPLYEELGTHKMSDSQIRLTLLSAFENGMTTGDFEINGEIVRQRCQDTKCYDMKNFTKIFLRNNNLFDNLEKYNKDESLKLSSEGKTELLKVLKYLASK